MNRICLLGWLAIAMGLVAPAPAGLRISEFMADNSHTLQDEDLTWQDWIEIQNPDSNAVNLAGWFLTDSAKDLQKWSFPATNLDAGGYLVVFASNKDRRVAGAPLHTNFKLDATGEYLALVAPDGVAKATEFAPKFPPQFPDVSYGIGMEVVTTRLVASNAPVRYWIPTDASADTNWTSLEFEDEAWAAGTNGLGYDLGLSDPLEDAYATRVLQANPVAYWRLDETSGAAAGNLGTLGAAANGVYQGGVALGAPGPRPPAFPTLEPANNAPRFDGASSYVQGPPSLLDNLAEFTLAGWINPAGVQASRTGLFGQNDLAEFGFINATTLNLWSWRGAVSYTYSFPTNEWHHVAAVGGATQLQLYVDGNLVASSAASGTGFGTSAYRFNIGGGGVFDASGDYFLGQIDEVAVWSRALAANEIAVLLATNSTPVRYTPYLATDVRSLMFASNTTAYVRVPFAVADPSVFRGLRLRLRYDDGFVAYLNGQEIARHNAPDTVVWNSAATQRHANAAAVQGEDFDVSAARFFLQPGTNVLAIQGLNLSATNTDFLVQAELVGESLGAAQTAARYFVQPTPGAANGFGGADLGPMIMEVRHTPTVPLAADNLVVTARVEPAFHPVAAVTLNYRVMFNAEVPLAMNDSGTDGDAVAGDGLWTGVIPASVGAPGLLVRYSVTAADTAANVSRWPLFTAPTDSEQYLGTVVGDPAIASQLPGLQVFVENQAAADTDTGTRATLFFRNELYDNVRVTLHGQTSAGWPKKSYNFDFNSDHRFLFDPALAREKDIKLLSPYGDKTRLHTTMTFDTLALAGAVGHRSFQVRVHRNGALYGIEDLVEDGDDLWLARLGRNPDGALYKMYNAMTSAAGNEKRSRAWDPTGTADLTALINNLNEALPLATRVRYAYDNLDLPQTVGFFATAALVSSQDHGHKNYYLYRDSDRSGEWAIFPWDVDLTWGRNWTGSLGYFSDILYQTNVLNFYDPVQQTKPANRLYDLVFSHPAFRSMYLRRLRTLMDTLLMPAGTATNLLRLEPRIRELVNLMDPPGITNSDALLDRLKWGPTWGDTNLSLLRTEAERTIAVHLAGRRDFLFNSPNATVNGDRIPPAQPAGTTLAIVGWDVNPASGNQDEEYVCVTNANGFAVDVSGWKLDGGVQFRFKPGTVIPAGSAVYVSPNVTAFRARATGPRGGQGLFVQGDYGGHLNAWGETLMLADDTGRLVATTNFVGTPSLAQRYLRITEIMYNPAPTPGDATDPQQFEYVELKNTSTNVTLDLAGVRFTNGIAFNFTGSAIASLAPGQRVLVVRNAAAFAARYGPGRPVAGEFAGALQNGVETLRLEDAVGEKILEFAYDNQWYPITDGLGFSLVIVDELAAWDSWGRKSSWWPSGRFNGSPGAADPAAPAIAPIVINEALVHTDLPAVDSVELWNPTAQPVDLGGWFLTDDFFTPQKYRLPPGFSLAPGAYALFTADQFGVGTNAFHLSSLGESVYLFGGDSQTNLTGYYHGFNFGPSPNGVSFGRHVNSAGEEDFVLQSTNTLGTNNAPPRVGPVVISEIMYHPPAADAGTAGRSEFLELQNLTATNVPLFDPACPTNTWRLRNAVDFDFPTNVWLPPGGRLLVVGFDPANAALLSGFQSACGVPTNVPVFGPWSGQFSHGGEPIELKRPDNPEVTPTNVLVPYYLVEKIHFQDTGAWSPGADGAGNSLQRLDPAGYGNEPTNWFAAGVTAGRTNVFDLAPEVSLTAPADGAVLPRSPSVPLRAEATDADGTIARVSFREGTNLVATVSNAPFAFNWTNAPFGPHVLVAWAVDNLGAMTETPAVNFVVTSAPPAVVLASPAAGTIVTAGTVLTLTALVSDPDGTLAAVDFYADGVWLGALSSPPFSLNWTAATPGAHTLSAVARDTGGTASPASAAGVFVQAVLGDLVLVPAGASWSYLDTGVDQKTNWIGLNFDDAGWSNGLAQLGYGDGDEKTVIRYGSNANSKYPTYYFRTKFFLDSTAGATNVLLRLLRDDGAIAYLNGGEVFRSNMTNGLVTYSTWALTTVSGAGETTFYPTNFSPGRLRAGTNVLAVEVHQDRGNSSDMSFNAGLTLQRFAVSPAIVTQPQSQVATWTSNATFTVAVTGSAPVADQWYFNGAPLPGQTNMTLTLTSVQPAHAGSYAAVLANVAGAVTSVVATLTLNPDTDGDGMPDAWELANGLNPFLNDTVQDADHDGMGNLQEYVAGTCPTNAASALRLQAQRWGGTGAVGLAFAAVSNHSYTVQWLDRLDVSPWRRWLDIPAAPTNRDLWVTNLPSVDGAWFRLLTPAAP